jgi:hypothetical protein
MPMVKKGAIVPTVLDRSEVITIPRSGYRQDGSAVYRKGNEFLIVRPNSYGVEKIVTYGINEG